MLVMDELRRKEHINELFRSPISFTYGDQNPDPVSLTGCGEGAAPPSTTPTVRYRECLKNHAATVGGNINDGCCEFMPGGDPGTIESLKCAACECHRNFHLKEIDGQPQFTHSTVTVNRTTFHLPPPLPYPAAAVKYPFVTPMSVAFNHNSGGGTESSSEDLNGFHPDEALVVPAPAYGPVKKRNRTKFTLEQKEKMLEIAEKVGWRFQKQNEEEVEKMCAEIGVKRQIVKVWMNNNKSTMKKQEPLT